MLEQLTIENLGVIESAVAEFSSGFNVVTGETGAGKTMVVSGLRLLSGERADAGRVRKGAQKAIAEGIFTQVPPVAREIIEQVGGYEDEEVVLARTVNAEGGSRGHLAGRSVPAGVLQDFSEQVLTIHGQNDQLQLLDPTAQLYAIDTFAGLSGQREKYQSLRENYLNLQRDYETRLSQRNELSLEIETLTRALEHIDGIDPQPGEDEELKRTITQLQDADSLREAGQNAINALEGGDMDNSNATEFIQSAQTILDGAGQGYEKQADRLRALLVELGDIIFETGQIANAVPDPDELQALLSRQSDINELKKYAPSTDEVLQWRQQAQQRLDSIDVSDEAIEALRYQAQAAQEEMLSAAQELSASRKNSSEKFAHLVSQEIQSLLMQASLEISQEVVEPTSTGIDKIEFLLNQGGQATALKKSASGGELSRVMLALEVIMASQGKTLVFDEVDAGVGGKAAMEIGKRLAALAKNNQVIVVTHLPQVAAFADQHLYVDKSVTDSEARSHVRALDAQAQQNELARMLAGLDSDTGRAHAQELLHSAQDYKNQL